ncbi:hypothetical protein UP09_09290 [Bradyrhizobium sp. LTSP885]|uniref:hypothetical protein n=1 Tax=Bradyrhizobium sp. LTSP885 TaxID=1619232 RepID=UPI0005CA294F|nr:hypothetical protein [Bradyrhizobium sp. LTSP885]KJC47786.1 hypothetical protein UP09_09290 [Bradyrhizobium sp. LTSP885]
MTRGRRSGAILLLRLACVILRSATALYQRRIISGTELRAALAAAGFFERAGAAVALGTKSGPEPERAKKDDDGDRIE